MSDPSKTGQGDIPACPEPDDLPHGPRGFVVPAGSVDTHAHVIGQPPDFPFVAGRSYTPPVASAERYLAMLDATGMAFGVLIQVSVHGTDNRLLVETLQANPRRLRGVAVVSLGQPDRVYRDLKEAGIVGLRLNDLFGGGVHLDAMADYGALCLEMGWHLQFLTDARRLPQRAGLLRRLPVPFVIDHMGHFPTTEGLHDAGFQSLLSLVRDGGWVKLSGAFRTSVEGPPYRDTLPYARALAEAASDRCVWGSDWPHVAHWQPMPNVGDLLDVLGAALPDEAVRNRVLADNPQRLYGFGPA